MNQTARIGYLEQVESYFDKNLIIVLVGQRRVGKSSILLLLNSKLNESEGNNVIFIDKERHEFDHIQTYTDLNNYVGERIDKQKKNYILIDEVQDIKEFERSVRSWRNEPNTNIVITGSNARMFSAELATQLAGRYHEVQVEALSYKEFLTFHNLANNEEALEKYIEIGGLPGLVKFGTSNDNIQNYQADILNTVLIKDVLKRNEVRNVGFLERLVHFLADNVGTLISANSLSKYMKSQGETVTVAAVNTYLKHLADALIIRSAMRYDIHGKKILETNEKYYFSDHGIRNAVAGGTRIGDIEKVMENIVYLELLRLGYNVYVGQLRAGEIDFVATKNDGSRVYVQVSYLIADHDTYEREFGALRSIRDSYPKYVISMNPMFSQSNENGIIHLHLRRFLTSGFSS